MTGQTGETIFVFVRFSHPRTCKQKMSNVNMFVQTSSLGQRFENLRFRCVFIVYAWSEGENAEKIHVMMYTCGRGFNLRAVNKAKRKRLSTRLRISVPLFSHDALVGLSV